MKHVGKLGFGLAAVLALATLAPQASASGLVIDAKVLPAKARASLEADVARARAEAPRKFSQVAEIAKNANAIERAGRRRGIPLTLQFKALGPRALMPMLEILAWDAHVPADLTPSAREALEVGLVEAVGIIRDGRAVPVLVRVLDSRDAAMTRAAAEALGRIGTDDAFRTLTGALGKAKGDRELAILAGIGSCRREAAARLLADRLRAHPSEEAARVLAKALGVVGNAWAWRTLTDRAEESATRRTAAKALVGAYVAYHGPARHAAGTALMVVDDPSTAALIAEAKKAAGADTRAAKALDALAARFAHNPTR